MGPSHLPFFTAITHSTPNLSVLVLGYTLAPSATYPTQLTQAIECLRYTLTTLSHPPASISIDGDSAGGNLALGVLSHLLHPHPEIPPLELHSPLGGAILLSPWASFSTHLDSMRENKLKDLVGPDVNDLWYKSFLGGRARDGYNEPVAAEEGWWNGLEGLVGEVLVLAGGDEVLVHGIRVLGGRLAVSHFLLYICVCVCVCVFIFRRRASPWSSGMARCR